MNRRISLVTAAAVAGTVFAGSAAIAANIGVLSAAEDNSIGNLSAEATVASPATNDEPQVIDIYIEDPAVEEAGIIKPKDGEAAMTVVTSAIRTLADNGTITLIVEDDEDDS